jgi:hypothetical protein
MAEYAKRSDGSLTTRLLAGRSASPPVWITQTFNGLSYGALLFLLASGLSLIFGFIGELKREGLSILLVEQNRPMAAAVADRVHVLSRGTIVYSGTLAALMTDEAVKWRYLGVA